ncbi:MAG: hypothetical protein AB7I27_15995 [Bacteriovoracaceae bacterium]
MKLLFAVVALFPIIAQAELVSLNSTVYGGNLWKNGRDLNQACYVQFNNVKALSSKGKNCQSINAQFMFNLDKIQPKELEIVLHSRKTNSEAEFHKPTTCAEVVYAGAKAEAPMDKWSSDTTNLFNEIFNAQKKVNGRQNHYTLVFDGLTKAPSHYMIYRVGFLTETSFECRNLVSF